LERCGTSRRGTITGFYTVLVEGDDMDEPVADTVRGILDGHIVLSRNLAHAYHYPPIDVPQSISRKALAVSGPESTRAAGVIRRHMAAYAEAENLINVGAYHSGSNPEIDAAIAKHSAIEEFLMQGIEDKCPLADTIQRMGEIAEITIPEEEGAAVPPLSGGVPASAL
jgi:flagellum-specific ATP synthase